MGNSSWMQRAITVADNVVLLFPNQKFWYVIPMDIEVYFMKGFFTLDDLEYKTAEAAKM